MNVLRQLLLCMCMFTHTTPLQDLHYRHRGSGGPVGDIDEPFVYAAIPLHGPVPVLQVLARKPLSGEGNHASSYQHPVYARPPRHNNEYASFDEENEYSGHGHSEAQNYIDPYQYSSSYSQQYASPSSHDEVTILYARPSPHGGFLYRRGPTKTAHKLPAPSTESPVIIRVHRYRVVRDP